MYAFESLGVNMQDCIFRARKVKVYRMQEEGVSLELGICPILVTILIKRDKIYDQVCRARAPLVGTGRIKKLLLLFLLWT